MCPICGNDLTPVDSETEICLHCAYHEEDFDLIEEDDEVSLDVIEQEQPDLLYLEFVRIFSAPQLPREHWNNPRQHYGSWDTSFEQASLDLAKEYAQ